MTKNIELNYDDETDILEIFIGEPAPCDFEEIDGDVFEGRDEKTNELKGYKVFNFLKRGGFKGVKKIKINLPVGVSFS
ncbi:MAG: hypothetical protein KJ879_02240 [Nanoarchaeota archaeon]|nr:hypothetical protein [Nanoarchaeota archaeon]